MACTSPNLIFNLGSKVQVMHVSLHPFQPPPIHEKCLIIYTCTIASNIQFFLLWKPSPTSDDLDPNQACGHHLPNWEILPESIVKPDTAPSCSPWGEKTSQMCETNTTLYITLYQIPLNEPNNQWKTGNCIWKVLIGSKMWSKFTEHPIKVFAINLWAQVLIRTNSHKLRPVISAQQDLEYKVSTSVRSWKYINIST